MDKREENRIYGLEELGKGRNTLQLEHEFDSTSKLHESLVENPV
jgi:hypothetical protein